MPLSTIFAFIVAGIGIVAVLFAPSRIAADAVPLKTDRWGDATQENKELAETERAKVRKIWRRTLIAGFVSLITLLLLNASFTQIGGRHVGEETSFGRPVLTLGEGAHLVNPFHNVEKFDASVKTLIMQGEKKNDDNDAAGVTVRLEPGTTARVDVRQIQWNLNQKADIAELYRQYRQFDNIEKNLLLGQVSDAVSQVFAGFDPLAKVNAQDPEKAPPVKSIDQLETEVQTKLQLALDDRVGENTILVKKPQLFVNYDGVTQGKINAFSQAQADTRIATQGRLTAEQRALANKALAAQTSVANPGVQYQNCLDLIDKLATADKLRDLPATFNCGGDPRSNVIVNGAK